MKVLHITSWYPSVHTGVEGIFVKEHFRSLDNLTEGELFHLQLKSTFVGLYQKRISKNESQSIIGMPFKSWKLIELLNFVFLLIFIVKKKVNKNFDMINFHIAYPQLRYYHLLKRFIKIPVCITEHWTAYHFNFNIQSPSKLSPIKRIFYNDFHLITVSEALFSDIRDFSGAENLKYSVVPNVVSDSFCLKEPDFKDSKNFFSVAVWRAVKKPLILLKAFGQVASEFPEIHYYIGGYGDQIPQMEHFIQTNNLEERVTILGRLDKDKIAEYMSNSIAFLHSSAYETFSVVCAESICVGTPVVASNIPAIAEFINETNGILVEANTVECWVKAMRGMLDKSDGYDRMQIAEVARSRFSKEAVGKRYYKVLESCVKSKELD